MPAPLLRNGRMAESAGASQSGEEARERDGYELSAERLKNFDGFAESTPQKSRSSFKGDRCQRLPHLLRIVRDLDRQRRTARGASLRMRPVPNTWIIRHLEPSSLLPSSLLLLSLLSNQISTSYRQSNPRSLPASSGATTVFFDLSTLRAGLLFSRQARCRRPLLGLRDDLTEILGHLRDRAEEALEIAGPRDDDSAYLLTLQISRFIMPIGHGYPGAPSGDLPFENASIARLFCI